MKTTGNEMAYFLAGIAALFLFNMAFDKPKDTYNNIQRYGTTGLPKNCRAIISSNIDGVRSGIYTYDEAMNSIDRNCGANGYSWEPY